MFRAFLLISNQKFFDWLLCSRALIGQSEKAGQPTLTPIDVISKRKWANLPQPSTHSPRGPNPKPNPCLACNWLVTILIISPFQFKYIYTSWDYKIKKLLLTLKPHTPHLRTYQNKKKHILSYLYIYTLPLASQKVCLCHISQNTRFPSRKLDNLMKIKFYRKNV